MDSLLKIIRAKKQNYFEKLSKRFNDETGEVLWKFQTGSGIYAPPTSFTIDGKQYIGIASGTRNPASRAGVATGISPGNYILFSL